MRTLCALLTLALGCSSDPSPSKGPPALPTVADLPAITAAGGASAVLTAGSAGSAEVTAAGSAIAGARVDLPAGAVTDTDDLLLVVEPGTLVPGARTGAAGPPIKVTVVALSDPPHAVTQLAVAATVRVPVSGTAPLTGVVVGHSPDGVQPLQALLPTTVDASGRLATAPTLHLSVFAAFVPPPDGVDGVDASDGPPDATDGPPDATDGPTDATDGPPDATDGPPGAPIAGRSFGSCTVEKGVCLDYWGLDWDVAAGGDPTGDCKFAQSGAFSSQACLTAAGYVGTCGHETFMSAKSEILRHYFSPAFDQVSADLDCTAHDGTFSTNASAVEDWLSGGGVYYPEPNSKGACGGFSPGSPYAGTCVDYTGASWEPYTNGNAHKHCEGPLKGGFSKPPCGFTGDSPPVGHCTVVVNPSDAGTAIVAHYPKDGFNAKSAASHCAGLSGQLAAP